MCLSKTASVSACVLEVGVGKPSVGQGRGGLITCADNDVVCVCV